MCNLLVKFNVFVWFQKQDITTQMNFITTQTSHNFLLKRHHLARVLQLAKRKRTQSYF